MMSAILRLIFLVSAYSDDWNLDCDGTSCLLTYGGLLRSGLLEERVSSTISEVIPEMRDDFLSSLGYLAPVIALVILK